MALENNYSTWFDDSKKGTSNYWLGMIDRDKDGNLYQQLNFQWDPDVLYVNISSGLPATLEEVDNLMIYGFPTKRYFTPEEVNLYNLIKAHEWALRLKEEQQWAKEHPFGYQYSRLGNNQFEKVLNLAIAGSKNSSTEYKNNYYKISDFDSLFGKTRVNGMARAWRDNPKYMLLWTDAGNEVGYGTAAVAAPYAASLIAPIIAPGTTGGNIVGQISGYTLTSTAANETYKGITGSNQGYMDDALDYLGIKNPVGRFVGYFADPLSWVNYGKVANNIYNTTTLALNTGKYLARGIKGEINSRAMSKLSSTHDFLFNWETGKFNITPKRRTVIDIVPEELPQPSPEHHMEIFYHGSPWRFKLFDTSLIGSGEGGAKAMRGINLWMSNNFKAAPKFANIKSDDAPLHLGRSSITLEAPINPTIYKVEGKGLNLYNTSRVKGLSVLDLIDLGYHGIRLPNQVTIFPQFVDKLSFTNPKSIGEFIRDHPEITEWTPFSTKYSIHHDRIQPEYGSFSPHITKDLKDYNLSESQISELREAEEKLFYNGELHTLNPKVPKLFDLAASHTRSGQKIYPYGYGILYRGYRPETSKILTGRSKNYSTSIFGFDENSKIGALSYTGLPEKIDNLPIATQLKVVPLIERYKELNNKLVLDELFDNSKILNELLNILSELWKLTGIFENPTGIATLVYPKGYGLEILKDVLGAGYNSIFPSKHGPMKFRDTDRIAYWLLLHPEYLSITLSHIKDMGGGLSTMPISFYLAWMGNSGKIPTSEVIYNNTVGRYLKSPDHVIFPDLHNESFFK